MLSSGNERQQKLGIHILDYLNREISLMDKKESHNASSDTRGSTFGVTKARKSNDKLAGVTPIILMMPLRHYFVTTQVVARQCTAPCWQGVSTEFVLIEK